MGLWGGRRLGSGIIGGGGGSGWAAFSPILSLAQFESNTGCTLMQYINAQDSGSVTFGSSPGILSIADKTANANHLTVTSGANLVKSGSRNFVQWTGTSYGYSDTVGAAFYGNLNKPHFYIGAFLMPTLPASSQAFFSEGKDLYNIYRRIEMNSSGQIVSAWQDANSQNDTKTSTASLPVNQYFLFGVFWDRNVLRAFVHDGSSNVFREILYTHGGYDRLYDLSRFAVGARYAQYGSLSLHALNIRYLGHIVGNIGFYQNKIRILEQACKLFQIPVSDPYSVNTWPNANFPTFTSHFVLNGAGGGSPNNRLIDLVSGNTYTPSGSPTTGSDVLSDLAGGLVRSQVVGPTDFYTIGAVAAAHNIATKTNFTVICRVKPKNIMAEQYFLSMQSAASTGVRIGHSSGLFRYMIDGAVVAQTSDIAENNSWHTIFIYRNGGNVNIRAYIPNGGTPIITTGNGAHVASDMLNQRLIFGGRFLTTTTAQNIFDGEYSEFLFSDSALTTTQMDQIVNGENYRRMPIDALV